MRIIREKPVVTLFTDKNGALCVDTGTQGMRYLVIGDQIDYDIDLRQIASLDTSKDYLGISEEAT